MNHRSPRRGGITLTVLLALGLVACGGGTTTAPAPSPTPTPTPTPAPFDVGAAFLDIVTNDVFSGRIDMTGTMELGVTAEISGSIDTAGEDTKMVFTTTVAGTSQTSETVTVDGVTYTRTNAGPWLVKEDEGSASSGNGFSAWLRSLKKVEDLGVVTKDGDQLHHLKPDKPLPDDAFLGSAMNDAEFTIDLYAKDDGTPAVFTIDGSWSQEINGQPFKVEMTMDMAFSKLGASIAVLKPSDVWTRSESALGYSMAHPADFSVETRDGYDAFVKGREDWFYVTTWPDASGLSADGFRDAVIANYAPDFGQPVITPTASTLAGEPAWAVAWQFTNDSGEVNRLHGVLAMHANVGWEVSLLTLPEVETDDLTLFNTSLTTFQFGS